VTARQASIWTLEHGVGYVHTDRDGCRWVVTAIPSGGWDLVMTYRDLKLRSHHPDADAAKRHYADMTAMWAARTMSDLRVVR